MTRFAAGFECPGLPEAVLCELRRAHSRCAESLPRLRASCLMRRVRGRSCLWGGFETVTSHGVSSLAVFLEHLECGLQPLPPGRFA